MQAAMIHPMTDEAADDRMRRLLTGQQARSLPRRFYKVAAVSPENGIFLDGKAVKTPQKSVLQLPNTRLAEAVAGEWMAQEKVINPSTMPLTKLANTAIDRATSERHSIIRELVQYANADLVCYGAASPVELADAQSLRWTSVRDWIYEKLGVRFEATTGIVHRDQSGETLAAFQGYLEQLDSWQLTAHYNISTLIGSALIATMLLESGSTPDAAWATAHVDEDFQIEQWGTDQEALERRAVRRAEFDACVTFAMLARENIVFRAGSQFRLN